MHTFTDPDLIELDRIWPLGQQLVVPENGLIVVAGAYEGRYLHYLSELFPSAKLVGFEPQTDAFVRAMARVGGNYRIDVHSHGLATADRKMCVGDCSTDGASLMSTHGAIMKRPFVDAAKAIHDLDQVVDLFVMNMEGYEWALIPFLLDEMLHTRIRSMAIQFHPKYVSEYRTKQVLEYLGSYYTRHYDDYPTWTYWKL